MHRPDIIIGQRYKIRHLLAIGGSGYVYLAEDTKKSFDLVAIKSLRQESVDDPHIVALFKREAAILKELHHPNIVRYLDYFEENGHYYLVLEHILGQNLTTFKAYSTSITQEKFAVAVFIQLVEALSYLENFFSRAGHFLHGDICPANIMINQDGHLKLLDFDASRIENSLVPTTKVRGRLRYMSPEIFRGESADSRSDIFVVGLLMYELLIGHSLFTSDSMASTNLQIKNTEEFDLAKLCALPGEISLVVSACLKKDPTLRPRSFSALKQSIAKLALLYGLESPAEILKEHAVSSLKKPFTKRAQLWFKIKVRPALGYLTIGIFATVMLYGALASKEYLSKPPAILSSSVACEENFLMQTPLSEHENKTSEHHSAKGILSVQAKPWAKVFVNNDYRGITPLNALSLVPGKYIIELKNPNFSTVVLRHVTIYADKKSNIHYDFGEEE